MNFKHLICLIALLPLFAFAQNNYQPGYVVNLQNDTLKGYVDYKDWNKNPQKFYFKAALTQSEITCTASNSLAFGVYNKEHYQSFLVKVSQNNIAVNNISRGIDTSFTTEKVFLRILEKGENIILYNYNDNLKTRYYVLEKGRQTPVELSYQMYINSEEGDKVVTIKRYRNQLVAIADKNGVYNDVIAKKIDRSTYSDSDLKEIAALINNGVNLNAGSEQRTSLRLFVGVGVNNSSFKYMGNVDLAKSGTSNYLFPKLDVGVDLLPNKNVSKVILRADFSATYSKHQIAAPADLVKFNRTSFSFSPQLIYNVYNKPSSKIYLGVAPALNVYSDSNHELWLYYNAVNYTVDKQNWPFQKAQLTLAGQAGVVLNNRLDINFYYQVQNTLTTTVVYYGKMTQYGAGINYLFGQ